MENVIFFNIFKTFLFIKNLLTVTVEKNEELFDQTYLGITIHLGWTIRLFQLFRDIPNFLCNC